MDLRTSSFVCKNFQVIYNRGVLPIIRIINFPCNMLKNKTKQKPSGYLACFRTELMVMIIVYLLCSFTQSLNKKNISAI